MDLGAVLTIVSIALSVIAVALLVVVLTSLTRHRAELQALRRDSDELRRSTSAALSADGRGGSDGQDHRPGFQHVAVVMNPSKHDDPDAFRERLRQIAERIAGVELTFHDTTREDAGYGQALAALDDDADLVIAAGGDGTVRMVAAALAHSGVRMGILPVGTGNLMARNLDIPLGDLEKALRVSLEGEDRGVDMGWMRTGTSLALTEQAEAQPFLVIAGVGADAEIIGATDPTMKKRIGWPAYVIPGLSRIIGRSFDARVEMVPGRTQDLEVRTVLIGNVGKLPAGIVLMPDADASNGKLEILALSWRGAAGLSQIAAKLVNPHAPTYPQLATMEKGMVSEVRVTTAKPQPVQLDGDTEDRSTHIIARVDAGALLMRVPAKRAG